MPVSPAEGDLSIKLEVNQVESPFNSFVQKMYGNYER
jgi:hypothetical protein